MDVTTARQARLERLDDGELLERMQGRFDVLVTLDKRLREQQTIAGRPVAVVVLSAPSSKLASLVPLVPEPLEVLKLVRPGEVRVIGGGPVDRP